MGLTHNRSLSCQLSSTWARLWCPFYHIHQWPGTFCLWMDTCDTWGCCRSACKSWAHSRSFEVTTARPEPVEVQEQLRQKLPVELQAQAPARPTGWRLQGKGGQEEQIEASYWVRMSVEGRDWKIKLSSVCWLNIFFRAEFRPGIRHPGFGLKGLELILLTPRPGAAKSSSRSYVRPPAIAPTEIFSLNNDPDSAYSYRRCLSPSAIGTSHRSIIRGFHRVVASVLRGNSKLIGPHSSYWTVERSGPPAW